MRSVGLTEETSPFNPRRQQDEGAPLALLLLIAGEIHTSLDVSRLEHQEVRLSRTRHSVHTLMRSVKDRLSSLVTGRQGELSFEVQSAMAVPWIDQDMIRRVLVNLIMNAMQNSHEVLVEANKSTERVNTDV
jgi:K+-sensing histidine kinase KdpD